MSDKARILFVDDEKRVLNSMRGLFRRDYELFLASEGADAIRIASENEIDVIVADQRMPGMTGIEVLERIKERSPRTVRILLTGYADPSAVEGSINVGEVFRFLSKPCPPKMLRETLNLAISAARTTPVAPSENAAAPAPRPTSPQAVAPRPTPPQVAPAAKRTPALEPVAVDEDTQPALPTLNEADVVSAAEQSSTHWRSVTNVVMSEDTVEETQENAILSEREPPGRDIGVVIFTVDSAFASDAIRAVSADRDTILATTLVKVAQAIEQQNAGVLVTDFTTKSSTLQKIVGALKRHMPELVTIVVSNGRDTTDMINLINYGQIFRYVLKPVEPAHLRSDIDAAVMRHQYLLSNPESAKRHQVIDTVDTGSSSITLNKFIDRVRDRRPRGAGPADTVAK